jgi:hypothetical protein
VVVDLSANPSFGVRLGGRERKHRSAAPRIGGDAAISSRTLMGVANLWAMQAVQLQTLVLEEQAFVAEPACRQL